MKEEEYDLIVIGATPGGIACAVRAARAGLRVLLTNSRDHVGGVLTSGLSGLDTQYTGRRSNIFSEFCDGILNHYRSEYGKQSEQFQACLRRAPTQFWIDQKQTLARDEERPVEDISGGYFGRLHFEPHVAERVLNDILNREERITLLSRCYPKSVIRSGRTLTSVILGFHDRVEEITAAAEVFVDATSEADLAALAGVPYRVGRESRAEYSERHAGKIFMGLEFAKVGDGEFPQDAVVGKLNLIPYDACTTEVIAGSTGAGDTRVQAYNYRLCFSCDPENRVMPGKPENYDRAVFLQMRSRWGLGTPLPNNKMKWNAANLPGGADEYPDGDWTKRAEIERNHRDHALGFLYFLQNDEAVPEGFRKDARRWGLAMDEFTDNGNFPFEMYVREARRIVGRYVFTEHDATLAPGLMRTPIHHDSIAIAEHPMDSHSVSFEARPGSRRDGKILLSEFTRPSQIPFRTLLPKEVDNLIVTGCLSSSHVGWGTLRVEPVMMHVGESAGYAAALASAKNCLPAELRCDDLQRKLVESGIMISFFNDFDMASSQDWVPAVQYFGTKGFFHGYNARPEAPLNADTARRWAKTAAALIAGGGQQPENAQGYRRSKSDDPAESLALDEFRTIARTAFAPYGEFGEACETAFDRAGDGTQPCTRGRACAILYSVSAHG